MWVYTISTKRQYDQEAVERALGTEYYNGILSEGDRSTIYRFEIGHQLPERTKDRLKFGNPGMAGFTEVGVGEPEYRRESRSPQFVGHRW